MTYLHPVDSARQTDHVLVRCDEHAPGACRDEYAVVFRIAERNLKRWGKHICNHCYAAAVLGRKARNNDRRLPDYLRGNQYEAVEVSCADCGTRVVNTRANLRANWSRYGRVLCRKCTWRGKRHISRPARNTIRAKLRRALKESGLARAVTYEPVKLPPFQVLERPRYHIKRIKLDLLLACCLDLDPNVVLWSYQQLAPEPEKSYDRAFVYLDKEGRTQVVSAVTLSVGVAAFAQERKWTAQRLEEESLQQWATRCLSRL